MRIVWKHLPLDIHKAAMGAHMAAVAAEKQGKFWEFHDKLFANQQKLGLDELKRYARDLGLDMGRFEKDLLDPANKKKIDEDTTEAQGIGLTGTPGFFINGHFLSGAKPFEEFAKVINNELARLNLAIPAEAPQG